MDNITVLNEESLEHMLDICCYNPGYKLQVIAFSSDLKEEYLHHALGYITENYRLMLPNPLEIPYKVIGRHMRSTTLKLFNSSEIIFISGTMNICELNLPRTRCHHILLAPELFGRRNILIELGHRLIERQSFREDYFPQWTIEVENNFNNKWVEYRNKTPNIDVIQPGKRLNTADDSSLISFLF